MQPGQTVSHYEILERLGQGGMGVVYRARDLALDRLVAIKCLPQDLSLDVEAKARFVREAKAASALDHANICTIHEIAETAEGELYIVMAHYEGKTLEGRLAEEEFSVDRAVQVALQLARALERAHEAGIVHRDLKPANVMLTDRGEVKLLDFGIAKLSSAQTLTQSGAILGSSGYLSPEQIDSQGVDHRSDIWSLGVVLYEMLSRERPFTGDTEPAVMFAIINKPQPPLAERRADVPAEVARIIDRCLAKEAADRPQTATEVVEALAEVAGEAPTGTAGQPRRPAQRRVGSLVLVAILGALLVVAALAVGSRAGAGGSGTLPDSVLAVVPFTVRGSPDYDYLGEGMVDLLSAKLAGGFRTVDPRWVISTVNEHGGLDDPTAGAEVAASLGAGRYVTGQIVEVGDRITLTTYLFDSNAPEVALGEATVEGDADDLFTLIDETVAELLSGTSTDPGDRLRSMAAATSASLPATRAFLEGERFLRAGRYRDAAAAYNRAVELDSTFALAYYRKSVAADWIDAYDVRSSADRAMEYADRLSTRDRNLVEALHHRRHGRNDEAEQAYRAHLHQYPDEVEALVQLGEIEFHEHPRRGRNVSESMSTFQRAIDLEPTNLIAHIHLARLLAFYDSSDRLRATADYVREIAPESERSWEVEATYAFLIGDTTRQQVVVETLATMPWYFRWYAIHGVGRFARDPEGAEALLGDRYDHPLLMPLVPYTALIRGRHDEFRTFMRSLRDRRNPQWDLFEASILTSGTYEASAEELERLVGRLETATPGAILGSSWVPPYEDITEEFAAFERDYTLATLLLALDRVAEADAIIARMSEVDSLRGMESARDDVLLSLRAERAYRLGEPAAALEFLRQMRFQVPHAATVREMIDNPRARFLRAELERELGDRDVARTYYRGLDESWSPVDTYFRPAVYERLGQMAEEDGRPEEAIVYYNRLIELWSEAGPELIPLREEIVARRDALLPDRP